MERTLRCIRASERRESSLLLPSAVGTDLSYLSESRILFGCSLRFMEVPRTIMEKDLKTQEKEINEDLTNLGKKNKYLEKQLAEAQAQLKDIVS